MLPPTLAEGTQCKNTEFTNLSQILYSTTAHSEGYMNIYSVITNLIYCFHGIVPALGWKGNIHSFDTALWLIGMFFLTDSSTVTVVKAVTLTLP